MAPGHLPVGSAGGKPHLKRGAEAGGHGLHLLRSRVDLALHGGQQVHRKQGYLAHRQVDQLVDTGCVFRERHFGLQIGEWGSGGLEQAHREGRSGLAGLAPGDGDVGELVGSDPGLHEMDEVMLGSAQSGIGGSTQG